MGWFFRVVPSGSVAFVLHSSSCNYYFNHVRLCAKFCQMDELWLDVMHGWVALISSAPWCKCTAAGQQRDGLQTRKQSSVQSKNISLSLFHTCKPKTLYNNKHQKSCTWSQQVKTRHVCLRITDQTLSLILTLFISFFTENCDSSQVRCVESQICGSFYILPKCHFENLLLFLSYGIHST